ncbi:MAG: hypothetical protein LBP22_08555 [Deltaproteobacteria bacterium]|jgi:hypothetical protein|nr:hypothetical protein [Deltaproteobacteria bacterium]
MLGTKKYSLAALFLCLWALTGCVKPIIAPFGGKDTPAQDGESFAEFLDVPYPSVMGLDRTATFTYTRRGVLAGTIVVAGRMTVDEAGAYFDLHLPPHGWAPLAEAQGSKIVSTWTKGDKVLTVIISSAFAITGQDSRIEMWVAPPHLKSDLGQRVVYKKAPEPREHSTTPQRQPNKGAIREENL